MEARFDCPRDQTGLTRRKFRGISYGHCGTCDGLWFARQDLAAPVLAEAMVVEPDAPFATVEPSAPLALHTPCPACRAPALRPFQVAGAVIDICRYCGGIWLDAPEFGAVAPAYRAWKAAISRWNSEARPGLALRPDPPETASAGAEEAALVYDVLFALFDATTSGGNSTSSDAETSGGSFGGGGGFSGGGSSGTTS